MTRLTSISVVLLLAALSSCGDDDPVPAATVSWTSTCSTGCREQPARVIDGVNGEGGIQVRCQVVRGAGGLKTLSFTTRNASGMPEYGIRVEGAAWNNTGPAGGPGCQVTLTEQFQSYGPNTCNGGTPCRVTITQESSGSVDGSLNVAGMVSCDEVAGPDPSAPFRGIGNGSFQINDCVYQ